MKHMRLTNIMTGLAIALIAAPAYSQENVNAPQNDNNANRAPNQQATQNKQKTQQQDRLQTAREQIEEDLGQASQEQNGKQRPIVIAPGGWVTIYADYDRDGRIDSKETIYYLDLMQAREQSGRRQGSRENIFEPRRKDQMVEIQGRIEDQKEFTLFGHDGDKFVMARMHTERDKTVPVVLGTRKDLKELDLTKGNIVTVEGEQHRLNNRPVLFAHKVSAEGKTVDVTPPESQNLHRVRGTIERVDRRRFRGREGEFLVAHVELVNGNTKIINLGPGSKLDSLNLKKGDEVRVLGHPGRINNEPALIASEVYAKDQTVSIPPSPFQHPSFGGESTQTTRKQDRGTAGNR